jgi:hypothetical protein
VTGRFAGDSGTAWSAARSPRCRSVSIAQVNPAARTMRVSARTGDGVDAFRRWLVELPARTKAHA